MQFLDMNYLRELSVEYSRISTDGKPLFNDWPDLWNFPMDRVRQDSFFAYFLHPVVPLVAVVIYLVLEKVAEKIFVKEGVKPKRAGPLLKAFTVLHSAGLAVYSMVTFYLIATLIMDELRTRSVMEVYCDADNHMWNRGLGAIGGVFYLSKIPEFIDSFLVIFRGRKAMFLQVYHHAGVVLTMWGLFASMETGIVVITTLNSFIHSIMYSYYTLAALGYRSPWRQLLTTAQMIQFLIGISVTVPAVWFMPVGCATSGGQKSLAAIQIYAVYLTYLFYQFYKAAYNKKQA